MSDSRSVALWYFNVKHHLDMTTFNTDWQHTMGWQGSYQPCQENAKQHLAVSKGASRKNDASVGQITRWRWGKQPLINKHKRDSYPWDKTNVRMRTCVHEYLALEEPDQNAEYEEYFELGQLSEVWLSVRVYYGEPIEGMWDVIQKVNSKGGGRYAHKLWVLPSVRVRCVWQTKLMSSVSCLRYFRQRVRPATYG